MNQAKEYTDGKLHLDAVQENASAKKVIVQKAKKY